MKYRFYHELVYQAANVMANLLIRLAKFSSAMADRCIRVMQKMVDREIAWIDELK